jgi:hypothetical protein
VRDKNEEGSGLKIMKMEKSCDYREKKKQKDDKSNE